MKGAASSPQLQAARVFGERLDAQRWEGGVRIVLQGAMRAPIRDGNVSLEASWRADVFYAARSRRAAFTIVAETPAAALRDLAAVLDHEVSFVD